MKVKVRVSERERERAEGEGEGGHMMTIAHVSNVGRLSRLLIR